MQLRKLESKRLVPFAVLAVVLAAILSSCSGSKEGNVQASRAKRDRGCDEGGQDVIGTRHHTLFRTGAPSRDRRLRQRVGIRKQAAGGRGGNYVLRIPSDGRLKTSSPEQYGWANDEYYYSAGSGVRRLPDSGAGSLIWGKINGEAGGSAGTRKYEEFFVGTRQQFEQQPAPISPAPSANGAGSWISAPVSLPRVPRPAASVG